MLLSFRTSPFQTSTLSRLPSSFFLTATTKGDPWISNVLSPGPDAISILAWFNNKYTTDSLFEGLGGINDFIYMLEPFSTPPSISRLRAEQNNLRKAITRVRMIRDTSFVSSAYAIAEALTIFTVLGFLLVNIEPFFESLFFIGIITYLLIYMLELIHDLDDPFEYEEGIPRGEEASLLPIEDASRRFQIKIDKVVK